MSRPTIPDIEAAAAVADLLPDVQGHGFAGRGARRAGDPGVLRRGYGAGAPRAIGYPAGGRVIGWPASSVRPVRRPAGQVNLDRIPAEDILQRLRESEATHARPDLVRAAADYLEGALLAAWHEDRTRA